MPNDPLNIGLTPTKEERHSIYREGKVLVVTFETENEHICYALDDSGTVWDFCSIGDAGIVNFQDELSEDEITVALGVLEDFRITLENS